MKLPGKSISYSNSVFALFPDILKSLQEKDMQVNELYKAVEKNNDFENFVNALDCLYALGRIDINTEGKLFYVEGNKM